MRWFLFIRGKESSNKKKNIIGQSNPNTLFRIYLNFYLNFYLIYLKIKLKSMRMPNHLEFCTTFWMPS